MSKKDKKLKEIKIKLKKKYKKKYKKKFDNLKKSLEASKKELSVHYKKIEEKIAALNAKTNKLTKTKSNSKTKTKARTKAISKTNRAIRNKANNKIIIKNNKKEKNKKLKQSRQSIQKIPPIPEKYKNIPNVTYVSGRERLKARIMRNGKQLQKDFIFSNYGSWLKVATAAKEWINKKKKILPEPRKYEDSIISKNNKTGILGVYRSQSFVNRQNKKYAFELWTATWSKDRKRIKVSWGINYEIQLKDSKKIKLNDKKAYILACACRHYRESDKTKIFSNLKKYYSTYHYKVSLNAYKNLDKNLDKK